MTRWISFKVIIMEVMPIAKSRYISALCLTLPTKMLDYKCSNIKMSLLQKGSFAKNGKKERFSASFP